MVQSVRWGDLSATGIVGTLVILGIVLYIFGMGADVSGFKICGYNS